MELCIDARMISSGGIGTVLKNLIPGLSQPPFNTTLILHPSSREREPWLKSYRWIPCDTPIFSPWEQFILPKIIPRSDLFWSPHFNVPFLPIRAKKRIVTIHDAYHLAYARSFSFGKRLVAKWLFSIAASRSDHIITDSEFSRSELLKYLPISSDKLSVVYPGVDLSRFSLFQEQKQLNLPPSFFLFVSNLKPHKNLRLLMEVYRKFPIQTPLLVVGKEEGLIHADPVLKELRTNPLFRGKIIFMGEVRDQELPNLYRQATALVFPSYYEGFGLPPLEAMASSCLAIVSNRASLPEVCGDAALYFDPDSSEALAQVMTMAEQEVSFRQPFIIKGAAHIQKFPWDIAVNRYRQIFQETCFSV
jgi:glycosyltransferase involved in cell wall biosynthesis